jgi:hypothetical protein
LKVVATTPAEFRTQTVTFLEAGPLAPNRQVCLARLLQDVRACDPHLNR